MCLLAKVDCSGMAEARLGTTPRNMLCKNREKFQSAPHNFLQNPQSALRNLPQNAPLTRKRHFLQKKASPMSPFGTLERYYYEQAQENRL